MSINGFDPDADTLPRAAQVNPIVRHHQREPLVNEKPTLSTFVTVLAWVFIVLAGLCTVMAMFELITLSFAPSVVEATATMAGAGLEDLPALVPFMRLLFLGVLLVSCATVASAVGLLRRKNWARLVFISIVFLGILSNIFCVVPIIAAPWETGDLWETGDVVEPLGTEFSVYLGFLRIFWVSAAIAISILLVWIIVRLVSPSIKAEFSGTRATAADAEQVT